MDIFKKILCFLFFLLILPLFVTAEEISDSLKIRKGAFIKVMNPVEFSTLISDIGDELYFINTSDLFLYETNVLPQNTKIYGEVEDILEPVQGRDGAIKILINKIITPDKKIYKVKGHIYSENDNYIGGKPTQSIYYRKVPHYTMRMKPMLQAAPLNVLEQGKHTVVKPGAELFLILDEDLIIK